MNGTPSAWPWIVAALVASILLPSTCFSSSALSTCVNRCALNRRTIPRRSMSATRCTASVTNANSSGLIAAIRKIGLAESARTM